MWGTKLNEYAVVQLTTFSSDADYVCFVMVFLIAFRIRFFKPLAIKRIYICMYTTCKIIYWYTGLSITILCKIFVLWILLTIFFFIQLEKVK